MLPTFLHAFEEYMFALDSVMEYTKDAVSIFVRYATIGIIVASSKFHITLQKRSSNCEFEGVYVISYTSKNGTLKGLFS